MSLEGIRQKADRLRAVPLQSVLRHCGARRDPHDRDKWHTLRGTISIRGAKFINWKHVGGGGGAIDLVIHLNRCSFREALDWLQRHFPRQLLLEEVREERCPDRSGLKLPPPDPAQLGRVRSYLLTARALSAALIDPLIESGCLYADRRANAVFLLLRDGSATPVGAELRGTASIPWRGMALGSAKNLGYFCVPAAGALEADRRPIILCESAVDAISCFALHPRHRCISTSGARPDPAWLPSLLAEGNPVFCGFDADDTGDRMARAMIGFHPEVRRLRPARHDWNELLRSRA
jgi:hypothetical protein